MRKADALPSRLRVCCARYDKMENTVRAYKRNKLKEDPAYKFKKLPGASGGPRPDVESKECLEGINVRAVACMVLREASATCPCV